MSEIIGRWRKPRNRTGGRRQAEKGRSQAQGSGGQGRAGHSGAGVGSPAGSLGKLKRNKDVKSVARKPEGDCAVRPEPVLQESKMPSGPEEAKGSLAACGPSREQTPLLSLQSEQFPPLLKWRRCAALMGSLSGGHGLPRRSPKSL